jgi:hypothetical protein
VTTLQTLLRWASTIACLIIVASFGLFAIDEAKGGSKQEVQRLSGARPNQPAAAPKPHGQPRRGIDDASNFLTRPFKNVIASGSMWAKRGVTALLGLLLWGVVLRIVAAYLPARR